MQVGCNRWLPHTGKGHDRSGRPDKKRDHEFENEDLLDVDHLTHGNWVA